MKIKNISLYDNYDNVIISCKITSLPLKEAFIIKESIEIFNDPEPCFIHRSAVMNRLFIGIDDYLNKLMEENIHVFPWELFPQCYKEILNIEGEINSITIQ